MQLQLRTGALGANNSDLMVAAFNGKDGRRAASFNGKIDGLKLYSRALTSREIADLKSATLSKRYARYLVANWDFARETQSSRIRDLSKNRLNGLAVNLPVRAVTGHNWSGDQNDFQVVPDQYNAIHFHDDDQGDAGWKVDFRYRVPKSSRRASTQPTSRPTGARTTSRSSCSHRRARPPPRSRSSSPR